MKNHKNQTQSPSKVPAFSKQRATSLGTAIVLAMSSCQTDDLVNLQPSTTKDPIEVVDKVDNLKKYERSPEQISDKIKVLFHLCYDKQEEITKEESADWMKQFQDLSHEEYIQYLNYWATEDSKKYGIDAETAKLTLFKRIDFSEKIREEYPNKIDLFRQAMVGNAMLNASIPVSNDPALYKGEKFEVVKDSQLPEELNTCFNMSEMSTEIAKSEEELAQLNMYINYLLTNEEAQKKDFLHVCQGKMMPDEIVLRRNVGLIEMMGGGSEFMK